MSFWDWLFGIISTPRDSARSRTVSQNGGPYGGAATATLERDGADQHAADGDAPWWSCPDGAPFRPVTIERPDLSPDARALENILISHFDGHDLQVPPLMQVAERALRKLGDAKANFSDVAREISEDPVIAASVLRLANSPLYRGTSKITSVQQGVTRLGQKAVRTLMLHESMRAAMFGGKAKDHFAEALWRHSLASAVVTRELARLCGQDEDDGYLLGLLHDIGAVLVLRVLRGQTRLARMDLEASEFRFLCQECHQEFGELIAAEWRLPPAVAAIAADHHRYPESTDEHRTARLQIILCDMIVSTLGMGEETVYNLAGSDAARDLGLAGRADFHDMLDALPVKIDDVFDAL